MRPRAIDAVGEAAGWFAGWTLAPVVGLFTRVRGARLFHAGGACYHAVVAPAAGLDGDARRLAAALAGPALVRLSAALWRRREWPDILGLGLRFYGGEPPGLDDPGVQDLLLATAPSVLGLPVGLALTDPHDFLANEYAGLARFEVDGLGPVRVRVLAAGRSPAGADRGARLAAAVDEGIARLGLELSADRSRRWQRIVEIELREAAAVDERRLRFCPFRAAAGLRPSGFWQLMRVGPYRVAQAARGACIPVDETVPPPRPRRHSRPVFARRLRRAAARAATFGGRRG